MVNREATMWKDIVVLANSVKHDPGRCIAGREIASEDDDFGVGPWVRPVSRIGEGELHPRHFSFQNGSVPQIFDVVRIFVEALGNDPTQPENWLILAGHNWQRVHQWDRKWVVDSLIETPNALWLQPGVKTDRVTKDHLAANPPEQSLYLLEIGNATINSAGRKHRIVFLYKGVRYDLSITDPLISNITGAASSFALPRCLVCVSLAPAFLNQYDGKEYHYKIAAMVARYE